MSRYDGGWNRQPNREGPGAGMRGGHVGAYDEEMRQGRDAEAARYTAIYGPSRYGLGPYHERLRTRRRDDAELREEIEEALFFDTWVDAEAISVEVKEGIVTLRGSLPSYDEVRYATDDAWDVDGVRGVRSELTVREG